jgi:hypothetical protein
MLAKFAKGIVPAVTAIVALRLMSYLESLHVPRHEAVAAGAFVAACIGVIVETVISEAKKHSLFFRKIFDKRARFEGDWFIVTAQGSRMPYGAISIDYNPESDNYTYIGAAYDCTGTLASEWSADAVQFDIPANKIRFFCQTCIKGDAGAQHEAYGWLSFKKTHLRRRLRYARGDGFYAVLGRPELKGEFKVDRLSRQYVKTVLGRNHIGTSEDMARVISAYHQKLLPESQK